MNDLLPHKHGSEGTHSACQEMIDKLGNRVGCCTCNRHACKVNKALQPIAKCIGCTFNHIPPRHDSQCPLWEEGQDLSMQNTRNLGKPIQDTGNPGKSKQEMDDWEKLIKNKNLPVGGSNWRIRNQQIMRNIKKYINSNFISKKELIEIKEKNTNKHGNINDYSFTDDILKLLH